MFNAKITKLSENANKLRTATMDGKSGKLPTIGESFYIFGEALDKNVGNARQINTSMVTEVVSFDPHERRIIFKTLNSTYQLDLTDERSLDDLLEYADWKNNPYITN